MDYYALSFVRNADVIYELKHWLAQQGAPPCLLQGAWTRTVHHWDRVQVWQ